VEQAKRRASPVVAVGAAKAGPTPRLGPERIGAYLARQRELRGISLDELAQQTRIPVRSLQRLEGGAFDVEPDGFARGFVRTVAIALGLPADETLARMLPEVEVEGEPRLREPVRRALLALALLVVLAGAVGSIGWLASNGGRALAPGFRAGHDGLVVRRDPVRALAEETSPPGQSSPGGGSASAAIDGARSGPQASEGDGRAPARQPDRPADPAPR
jgi:hypothetical protein